jgi:FAD-dependent urate hydroxylase
MSISTDVAIIGAGPYGLSAAAKLRRAGVETHVVGDPMSFWRGMPAGMLLRSNWSASNIADQTGELSLNAFVADTGARFTAPIPLERFVAYGQWVQARVAADVQRDRVATLRRDGKGFALALEGGDEVRARRVVVACGIEPFARRPQAFDRLPAELASHTGDHADLGRFKGRRVAIVGGGQSALESAALLHEAGADVEVYARSRRIVWLKGGTVQRTIGPLAPIFYAPTDVGPLWYSRLNSLPDAFRRLPRRAQDRIAARSIRPAGSHWVRARLGEVPIHAGATVTDARERGGRVELAFAGGDRTTADHVLLGTGYRVDVARYPFLGAADVAELRRVAGAPVLGPGLESSIPGLHFLGAPAAWSFGPLMRFVSGSWYASDALTRTVTARPRRAPRAAPSPVAEPVTADGGVAR